MKKILILLLALGMTVTAFGCEVKEKETKQTKTESNISAFESLDELWYGERNGIIGKFEINRDKRFISEGNASLKMTAVGTSDNVWFTRRYHAPILPMLTFYKYSEYVEDLDLARLKGISVDVYNDTEREMALAVSLNKQTQPYDYRKDIYADTCPVYAKRMNRCYFPISRRFITDEWENIASYILYIYDPLLSSGEADREENVLSVVYFDNFKVHYTDEKPAPVHKFFGQGEILDFRDEGDLEYVAPFSNANVMCGRNGYCSSAPGGGGALCCHFYGFNGSNGLPNTEFYAGNEKVGFKICDELLGIPDISDVKSITAEIYNGDVKERRFYIDVVYDKDKVASGQYDIPTGEWTQINLSGSQFYGKKIDSLRIYTNTYTIFQPFDVYCRNIRYVR